MSSLSREQAQAIYDEGRKAVVIFFCRSPFGSNCWKKTLGFVTAHRAVKLVCSCCGHKTDVAFPESIGQPAQYGPNLHGFATDLQSVYFLPLCPLCKDRAGCDRFSLLGGNAEPSFTSRL